LARQTLPACRDRRKGIVKPVERKQLARVLPGPSEGTNKTVIKGGVNKREQEGERDSTK